MGKSNTIRFGFFDKEWGNKISDLVGNISVSLIASEDGQPLYDKKIGDVKFIDKNDGVIDFNRLIETNFKTIESFWNNYSSKYQVEINLIIVTELSKDYKSFIEEIRFDPDWINGFKEFNSADLSGKNNFHVDKSNYKATDLKSLTMDFKAIELEYNKAKAIFEAEVKNNTEIELEVVNGYEPNTFAKVITRILEFQKGTLSPAIEFTKLANLKRENNNLTAINNIMNAITDLYPDIDLEMGEGMPYQK
jgi:hypothetical protein